MKHQNRRFKNVKIIVSLWVALGAIVATYLALFGQCDRDHTRKAFVGVEAYQSYTLVQNGKVVLVIEKDTLNGTGCFFNRWAFFPSCDGLLMVSIDTTQLVNKFAHVDAQKWLAYYLDSLTQVNKESSWKVGELNYYKHSHNVTDEGFNMISDYANHESQLCDSTKRMIDSLRQIQKTGHFKIVCQKQLVAICQDKKMPFAKNEKGIYQLISQETPDGISVLSPNKAQYLLNTSLLPTQNLSGLVYHPDSLVSYMGEVDSNGLPHGHGYAVEENGKYYEGNWENGKRNGFGFSIAADKPMRVGEWKNDVFKGEKLTYSSERIYGIDISKYQHVIGKKKYPINWKKLRITHLGNISKKTIAGNVDYPISFIYIKSTEGASLTNPYYKKDYVAARAHGFKVGSYHFFSTLSPAQQQAKQFLRHSYVKKGDFPPVLDVEPTHEQIKKMGGPNVLFARVRAWLREVEKSTGVKPILYISQTFVNRYLPLAPDIKNNYKVWIARYGEYKPDIRLVYWQLCPDGRVAGIHGNVDINVFNGYRDTYNNFCNSLR